MPVNKEELAKDLATPEYQDIAKTELGKSNFVVRSKDEEATFQNNYKKDVIEKEIPTRIKAVHDQYDKDVEEISGLKRDKDEKSYDFVKRALKANTGDSAGLKKEIEDLKLEIKNGDKTGATAKLLKETEEKYKTSLLEKDQLIAKLQGDTSTYQKENLLTKDYADIKRTFKKALPDMFEKTEKMILSEALSLGVIEGGVLYKGEQREGKLVIAKDASFNPIKMADYLKVEFKAVIETAPPPKGGTGAKGGLTGLETNPDEINADNFVMPDTIKTGGELMDYMLEQGLKRGTPAFDGIWEKFRPQLSDGKTLKAPAAPAPKK